MKKILVATSNKGKVQEIEDILKIPLDFASLEIDEVQSMDLEYVVRKKAEAAFKILKRPVIVDDVGVYLDALNSFPGPFVKYVYKLVGNKKLLNLLKNEKNRKLTVMCAVAYCDGKKVHTFVGSVKGSLSRKEIGKNGWGFDPIIIPNGENQTFAEMGLARKNELSHRRKALDKLKIFLDSQKT